ncbi:hypothetical protein COOONC_12183 [Cooperia oncophora]
MVKRQHLAAGKCDFYALRSTKNLRHQLGTNASNSAEQSFCRRRQPAYFFSDELNKVFVSLRQACCRDNGQLGTPCTSRFHYNPFHFRRTSKHNSLESTAPIEYCRIQLPIFMCRLKIMELVELRAMHWRSNLAHSQYYLKRPEQRVKQEPPVTPQPMTFLPQNPLFMPPETPPATHPTNAGFYLIPASGGWMPPMIPGIPPNPFIHSPSHTLMLNYTVNEV